MIVECPLDKDMCHGCQYGDAENLDCMHPEYSENNATTERIEDMEENHKSAI